MSDCCNSEVDIEQPSKRYTCPVNGKQYPGVPYATVLQHIKAPWTLALKEQDFYFCSDPNCEVVYFALDDTTINKDLLREKVGVKDSSDDALLCYCFGVSHLQARQDDQVKAFVMEQTRRSLCSCTTRNPSGRCCLKDFPKDK